MQPSTEQTPRQPCETPLNHRYRANALVTVCQEMVVGVENVTGITQAPQDVFVRPDDLRLTLAVITEELARASDLRDYLESGLKEDV